MIQSNPGTFAVEPEAGPQLRGPATKHRVKQCVQGRTQAKFSLGHGLDGDLQQYTETAIGY